MKTKFEFVIALVVISLVSSIGYVNAQTIPDVTADEFDPRSCGAQPTPSFTIVWGYMDINYYPVPAGKIVEAWAGDTIVGCGETIEGGLPATHVYGQDVDEFGNVVIPGAVDGQEIRFKMDGEWLETNPSTFTFQNDWDVHQLYFVNTPYRFNVAYDPAAPKVGESVSFYVTDPNMVCEYASYNVTFDKSPFWETYGPVWNHTFDIAGEHNVNVFAHCSRQDGSYVAGVVDVKINVDEAEPLQQKVFLPLVIR